MKVVKITKTLLKQHPITLAAEFGVSHNAIYLSNKDDKLMKKNLRAEYSRVYKNKTTVERMFVYNIINYGPNLSLADAIRPGYALVDDGN